MGTPSLKLGSEGPLQGLCCGPGFVGRASHRPPAVCAPPSLSLCGFKAPSQECPLLPRSPLWPVPFAPTPPLWRDLLTEAFCAEVSGGTRLRSQRPHGGQGGRRRGGWERGLSHKAGADGGGKYRLVCLSGGSSLRWESLCLGSLLTQGRTWECVWGGGSYPICAACAGAWWGFWLLFTFLIDWLCLGWGFIPGRGVTPTPTPGPEYFGSTSVQVMLSDSGTQEASRGKERWVLIFLDSRHTGVPMTPCGRRERSQHLDPVSEAFQVLQASVWP